MVNDPIADLLVRLQNASRVGHAQVTVPFSRIKSDIAVLLSKEGYVGASDKKNHTLTIALSYKNGKPAITGTKRVSKPSRRMYMGVRDIRPVKHGHGTLILSTPKGVMTGAQARQERLGGEVLFQIW